MSMSERSIPHVGIAAEHPQSGSVDPSNVRLWDTIRQRAKEVLEAFAPLPYE